MNLKLKHIITKICWLSLGIGVVVVFIMAMQQKNSMVCTAVEININNEGEQYFLDQKAIRNWVNSQGEVVGSEISSINLFQLERTISENPWIKSADLFFDNQRKLIINIEERNPIARLFTVDGNSYYIDKEGVRMPISQRNASRVMVVTGFPSANNTLSKPDSAILLDVVDLANYIHQHKFWRAMISQIDIAPDVQYDLIPVLGNQVIKLGKANDIDAKFQKLYSFYAQLWNKVDIEKYKALDLRFENQIVATKVQVDNPLDETVQSDTSKHSSERIKHKTMEKLNTEKPVAEEPKAIMKKNKTT